MRSAQLCQGLSSVHLTTTRISLHNASNTAPSLGHLPKTMLQSVMASITSPFKALMERTGTDLVGRGIGRGAGGQQRCSNDGAGCKRSVQLHNAGSRGVQAADRAAHSECELSGSPAGPFSVLGCHSISGSSSVITALALLTIVLCRAWGPDLLHQHAPAPATPAQHCTQVCVSPRAHSCSPTPCLPAC